MDSNLKFTCIKHPKTDKRFFDAGSDLSGHLEIKSPNSPHVIRYNFVQGKPIAIETLPSPKRQVRIIV
jgi:hypothetical protein